jgi:hypothetical protein
LKEPGSEEPEETPEQMLQRGLNQLRDALPCDIEFDEWLSGGTSAGPVAVIARSGPGFDDKVAVRLMRPSERSKWEEAMKDCPKEFSSQHLAGLERVDPLESGESDRWIATLKIAGGDLSLFRPFVEHDPLKGRSFASACMAIVKSVIGEWNPDPQRYPLESIPPWVYLNSIFDTGRVTPRKALWRRLESNGIAIDDGLIKMPEWRDVLPNPLMIAKSLESGSFGSSRNLRVFYGRAHGDLHLRNILMQVKPPKPRGYKLIDLGGYDPKSPLARDPMHLLLSISLEWLRRGIRPGTPASRALIDILVHPQGQSLEKEYQEVSRAIHDAGHSWAAAKSLGDEWTRQSLLSLVGCSLLYASRQISEVPDAAETRGWFFELAAVAGRAYLEDSGAWEHYVATYAIQQRKAVIAVSRGRQDLAEDAQASGLIQQESPPEADEVSDGRVLQFPSPYIPSEDHDRHDANQSQSYHQGQWEDLADVLRQVVFDSSSWLSLAASTDRMLRRLRETYAAQQSDAAEIHENLRLLDRTLADVLRPSASPAEVRAACSRAEALRSWLLDLLAEPGR